MIYSFTLYSFVWLIYVQQLKHTYNISDYKSFLIIFQLDSIYGKVCSIQLNGGWMIDRCKIKTESAHFPVVVIHRGLLKQLGWYPDNFVKMDLIILLPTTLPFHL